jgi:uncharacterized protein YceH (UPF0502 family)
MAEQYNAKTFYCPNRGSMTVHGSEEEAIARKRGWVHEYPHNVAVQTSDEAPEHPDVTAAKKDFQSEIDAANAKIADLEAKVDSLSTPATPAPPAEPIVAEV